MRDNKVCLYAICKNEEKHVERWLNAYKDVDIIVIVDTGSTDTTCELFTTLGGDKVKLYHQTWEPFSFGAAKQYALERAWENIGTDHNWIMMCFDLDEFLEDGAVETLKSEWQEDYDFAHHQAFTPSGWSCYVNHKIHSDSRDWAWERNVHEILTLNNENIRRILYSSINYLHDQDMDKSRALYYDILKADYEQDCDNLISLSYLISAIINDNLVDQFGSIKPLSQELIDKATAANNYELVLLGHQYLVQFGESWEEIKYHCDEIVNIMDNDKHAPIRGLYDLVATQYDNYGEYYQAIKLWEKCLTIPYDETNYSFLDNKEVWNNGVLYTKLMLTNYYHADPEEALIYGLLALREEPDNELYKMNMEFCKNKIKQPKPLENKVCVYAICKNESQFVDSWVDSMQEADKIIVLDTGSTDDTVEKLRARDVEVHEKIISPWRFDVARNECLALIPEEYNILISTDLDEILEPGWAQVLRDNWIEGVHQRATYKYSWSHLENGESGRVFAYNKIHSRNWIWKYPVHELLWDTINETELYSADVSLELFDQIHLHHYPDQTKSRSSYLGLLELRAQEFKEDWYGLIYLAHEYSYNYMYEKSNILLQRILNEYKDNYNTVEQASCYLFMGDNYMALGDYNQAIYSYLCAMDIEPTYREPYLNIAKAFMARDEYVIAKHYILMGLDKSYRHYSWLERDISWTYEPYDLLCLACYYNNEIEKSLEYAIQAFEICPTDIRLENNIKLIKQTLNKEV